jgi:hypothetical protein
MKNALLLTAMALWGCGCVAGSHCRVTARAVPQPVSCTPCVFDADGRIRTITESTVVVVRQIELNQTHWSMFWDLVPLSRREWDLSAALNKELRETSGDAIVNLRVTVSPGDALNGIAALLPIIPSYAHIKVEAGIIRLRAPPP